MTRIWESAAFAALLCVGLWPQARRVPAPPVQDSQVRQSLDVEVEDAADLWSRKDGTGYANDVVRAAFRAAGIDVVFHVVPYARCKQDVIEGSTVACFSMSPAPELKSTVILSREPLFVCYATYFESIAKPLSAKREQDLPRGTVVGTVARYEYPASLVSLAQDGRIVLDSSVSEDTNLRKLALGRIDTAVVNINDIKSADYILARTGLSGRVKVAFRGGRLQSYIGFSRKNPSGAEAAARFDAGFQAISTNGSLNKLFAVWLARTKDDTARGKSE